jgi:hypothetical protein
MRQIPCLLLWAAGVLWGLCIGADADDSRLRLMLPLLAGASVLTIAGLQQLGLRRVATASEELSRTYEALTNAVLARPLLRSDTGPIPAVTELRPADLERAATDGPSGRGTRRARHATR